MKDQLLVIVDALLMAKAELKTHYARRVKNAPRTVERLQAILSDPKLTSAMGVLAPGAQEAPSVVPAEHEDADVGVHGEK